MIVEECVHAYSSSYTSLACDSAFHTLGMDTEIVDSGSFHDNSTNNSRLTFSSGGIFLVFAAPQWSDPGFTAAARMTKNGTTVGYEYGVDGFAATPTQLAGPLCFWLENFSSGDYMESQAYNNRDAAGGGTNFRSARTQMAALKVSEWSAHVAGTTATALNPVPFATTIYDPHSMFDGSTKLVAQKAGYYLVLSVVNALAITSIQKNGSGVPLSGSRGDGYSPADYIVDWFEIGDYVEITSSTAPSWRQFAMVYMGDAFASMSYTYSATDRANTEPAFTAGVLRTDTEWIDTGHGHPQHGFSYNTSPAYCISCGSFNMTTGYHFGLVKISTNGGTFLQNDGCYTCLNGTQLGNVVSGSRHQSPSAWTTVAFSCFQAADGDTFTGNWLASGTFVEASYTPYTTVFVTDAAEGGQQIYRRL